MGHMFIKQPANGIMNGWKAVKDEGNMINNS